MSLIRFITSISLILLLPSAAHAKGEEGSAIAGLLILILIGYIIYQLIKKVSKKSEEPVSKNVSAQRTSEEEEQIKKNFAEKMFKKVAELDPIPTIKSTLPLQKGETCHLLLESCEVEEIKEVTTSVKYSVPQMRLGKGMFTWRIGEAHYDKQKEIKSVPIGKGTVYLTNKRIIFEGGVKNIVIPFSHILKANTAILNNLFYFERTKGGIISLTLKDSDDFLTFIAFYQKIRSEIEKARTQA